MKNKVPGKKQRIRPASSISPHQKPNLLKNSNEAQINSINNLKQFVKEANQNGVGSLRSQSQEIVKEEGSSNTRKMFNMKAIKFPAKKAAGNSVGAKNVTFSQTLGAPYSSAQGPTGGQLPKPPLAFKKNFLMQEAYSTVQGPPSSAEALLKMADEGLANIELELKSSQTKKTFGGMKNSTSVSTLEKIR